MDPYSPPVAQQPVKKKTSPWVWVGCGCGSILLLGALGFGGMIWWTKNKVEETTANFADPVKREQKAKEILPYETLPAGLKPMGGFSIPFLMDMALFTDQDIDAEGKPVQGTGKGQMLFFIKLKVGGSEKDEQEMLAYLRGQSPEPDALKQSGSNIQGDVILRGEAADQKGAKVVYSTTRGEFTTRNQDPKKGLIALLYPDCPNDTRIRLGIWFANDPAPGQELSPEQIAGGPADQAAVDNFANQFAFCTAE